MKGAETGVPMLALDKALVELGVALADWDP